MDEMKVSSKLQIKILIVNYITLMSELKNLIQVQIYQKEIILL